MKNSQSRNASLDFAAGLKSFLGYLEGTEKAKNTVNSYRLDLLAFQKFLSGRPVSERKKRDLFLLEESVFDEFHDYLKMQRLKTNTRRRKLITVQRFFNYLAKRKKVPKELAGKRLTPHKIERIPFTVSSDNLLKAIQGLPATTLLDCRNRVLLWILAETGCLVSELISLRYEQLSVSAGKCMLHFSGKRNRSVEISKVLYDAMQELKCWGSKRSHANVKKEPWVFLGFNKFGSLGSPITSRGVELLVKQLAPRLQMSQALQLPENIENNRKFRLTPRTFRHSAVLRWHQNGRSRDEIQKLMGLKTPYAFRTFETLLSSNNQ